MHGQIAYVHHNCFLSSSVSTSYQQSLQNNQDLSFSNSRGAVYFVRNNRLPLQCGHVAIRRCTIQYIQNVISVLVSLITKKLETSHIEPNE